MIILRRDFSAAKIEVSADTTDPKEEVCVDLSVGESYMEAGASEALTMSASCELKPGRCIIVQTSERVSVPNNVFGLLCSKGSLAARGFLVPNTKTDPLFSGTLDIAIYNAGKKPLTINKGMKFCSIIFQKIEGSTLSATPRGGPRISTEKINKFKAFFQEHAVLLITNIVTIIISVGSAAVAVWITLKHQ